MANVPRVVQSEYGNIGGNYAPAISSTSSYGTLPGLTLPSFEQSHNENGLNFAHSDADPLAMPMNVDDDLFGDNDWDFSTQSFRNVDQSGETEVDEPLLKKQKLSPEPPVQEVDGPSIVSTSPASQHETYPTVPPVIQPGFATSSSNRLYASNPPTSQQRLYQLEMPVAQAPFGNPSSGPSIAPNLPASQQSVHRMETPAVPYHGPSIISNLPPNRHASHEMESPATQVAIANPLMSQQTASRMENSAAQPRPAVSASHSSQNPSLPAVSACPNLQDMSLRMNQCMVAYFEKLVSVSKQNDMMKWAFGHYFGREDEIKALESKLATAEQKAANMEQQLTIQKEGAAGMEKDLQKVIRKLRRELQEKDTAKSAAVDGFLQSGQSPFNNPHWKCLLPSKEVGRDVYCGAINQEFYLNKGIWVYRKKCHKCKRDCNAEVRHMVTADYVASITAAAAAEQAPIGNSTTPLQTVWDHTAPVQSIEQPAASIEHAGEPARSSSPTATNPSTSNTSTIKHKRSTADGSTNKRAMKNQQPYVQAARRLGQDPVATKEQAKVAEEIKRKAQEKERARAKEPKPTSMSPSPTTSESRRGSKSKTQAKLDPRQVAQANETLNCRLGLKRKSWMQDPNKEPPPAPPAQKNRKKTQPVVINLDSDDEDSTGKGSPTDAGSSTSVDKDLDADFEADFEAAFEEDASKSSEESFDADFEAAFEADAAKSSEELSEAELEAFLEAGLEGPSS